MGRDRRRREVRRPLRTLAYIVLTGTLLLGLAGAWRLQQQARPAVDPDALLAPGEPSRPQVADDGRGGRFSVLTYDVAGEPTWLAGERAPGAASAIAERLNAYDLVLLQGDHREHDVLRDGARHPYASTVGGARRRLLRDGLARFSQLSFVPVTRTAWDRCEGLWDAGRDCLALKGFSRAETRLADDAALHVYNIDLDAGTGAADRSARARQLEQLAAALEAHSAGMAVIVAGDTKLAPDSPEDAALLAGFLDRTGLQDACDAMLCDAQSSARVLYRGATGLALAPEYAGRARELDGLSGREGVAVQFRWHLEDPGQRAAVLVR